MDIAIPAAPAGILTLLAFFAPYGVSALNGALPFVKTEIQKKIVAVLVAVVLAVVVIVVYQNITGEPIGNPWLFGLLSLVVLQASYALVTRDLGAKALERKADRSLPDPSVSTRKQYQAAVDPHTARYRDPGAHND